MTSTPASAASPNPEHLDLDGYVSVDIEASGPVPGRYAMLSLGACLVADPTQTFYAEFQPTSLEADAQAMEVHGLAMDTLQREGLPLAQGMAEFDRWLAAACPASQRPVLVSYNAPFDWMFVHDAFMRALGRNPFGHTALDIRAIYVGWTGRPWRDVRFEELAGRYLGDRRLTHHALDDALAQAQIFRGLMVDMAHGRVEAMPRPKPVR